MKTKARDIIPGWPRGGSQSRNCQDYPPNEMLRLGRIYWSELDFGELLLDRQYAYMYHIQQLYVVGANRLLVYKYRNGL